jgi:putative ATPase
VILRPELDPDGALRLRDANMDAKTRGHGEGYLYTHDFPGHFTPQEYMPSPLKFYEPSDEGDEARMAKRLKELGRKKKSS